MLRFVSISYVFEIFQTNQLGILAIPGCIVVYEWYQKLVATHRKTLFTRLSCLQLEILRTQLNLDCQQLPN